MDQNWIATEKKITNVIKLLGFKITIDTNLKTINFLDITLNLKKNSFESDKKEKNALIYMHTSSNHPSSIIKQKPKSISRRLSDNTSNINIFNKNKHIYDNALKIAVINKH